MKNKLKDGKDNFSPQLILIIDGFCNHKNKCDHVSDCGLDQKKKKRFTILTNIGKHIKDNISFQVHRRQKIWPLIFEGLLKSNEKYSNLFSHTLKTIYPLRCGYMLRKENMQKK